MNLRSVYTLTISFVILHVTMVTSDAENRDCDAQECDAECKYRSLVDHGKCLINPWAANDYTWCYCYDEQDSPEGLVTPVVWCRDEEPDYRCPPIFNRSTPNCNFTDCQNSCRSRYEGQYWRDVSGTCKRTGTCTCFGKDNSRPDSDAMWSIY